MSETTQIYKGKITSIEPELEDVLSEFSVGFHPEGEGLTGFFVPIKYNFGAEYDLAQLTAAEISRRLKNKGGVRVEVCIDRKIDITGKRTGSSSSTNRYEGIGLIKFLE